MIHFKYGIHSCQMTEIDMIQLCSQHTTRIGIVFGGVGFPE